MGQAPELRLYVLDGGRIHIEDARRFSDDGAYVGRAVDLPVPAFLVRHPGGDLIWDTGLSTVQTDLPEWAKPGPPLSDQLAGLGLALHDIRFLAVSHGHFDHIGNAGLFSAATWLVHPAERAALFDEPSREDTGFATYAALESAQTHEIRADHDVFGDGSVVIVKAPGHTPGHALLLVRLPKSGPLLLSGDLWHFAESRAARRVPPDNFDRAQTLASMDRAEELVRAVGARVIIQHEAGDIAALPSAPEYLS